MNLAEILCQDHLWDTIFYYLDDDPSRTDFLQAIPAGFLTWRPDLLIRTKISFSPFSSTFCGRSPLGIIAASETPDNTIGAGFMNTCMGGVGNIINNLNMSFDPNSQPCRCLTVGYENQIRAYNFSICEQVIIFGCENVVICQPFCRVKNLVITGSKNRVEITNRRYPLLDYTVTGSNQRLIF